MSGVRRRIFVIASRDSLAKVAVTESAIMNTQAAVFGICNPETGYGAGQGYPGVASEHLAAFYGAGGGGGSSGGSSAASSGGGGGASSGEPSSPSPYGSGSSGAGGQGAGGSERHSLPETKYEPSHSPSSGLISSDNGLQYANLDTGAGPGELKGYPGSGYPASGASHPGHQAYQAHHSLVQSAYAHHYGTGHLGVNSAPRIWANKSKSTKAAAYFKAV